MKKTLFFLAIISFVIASCNKTSDYENLVRNYSDSQQTKEDWGLHKRLWGSVEQPPSLICLYSQYPNCFDEIVIVSSSEEYNLLMDLISLIDNESYEEISDFFQNQNYGDIFYQLPDINRYNVINGDEYLNAAQPIDEGVVDESMYLIMFLNNEGDTSLVYQFELEE